MLTALSGRLVGMDDGLPGANGQVLRLTGETHQQQIAGRTGGECDTLQAWLCVERSLQLPIGGRAPIAGDVEMTDADLPRHMDGYAGTIEAECDQATLVAEWRSQALPCSI